MSGVVSIFFKILELSTNTYNVFRGEAAPSRAKATAKYWYKIFLLKHIVQFEIWKSCISRLSIKMLIKKQKQERPVLTKYQIPEFWDVFEFWNSTVSVVKQPSSDKTRFFVVHYPMSGANIQACLKGSRALFVSWKVLVSLKFWHILLSLLF